MDGKSIPCCTSGEIDGEFKNYPEKPFGKITGTYMDFIKQVFIADPENKRIVKTDEWGRVIGECGEGILRTLQMLLPLKITTEGSGYQTVEQVAFMSFLESLSICSVVVNQF
ncbi:MAG: hypothetical protein R2883_05540 [Caldisericia bacterium]